MVDAMNSVKKLALYPCLSVLAHTLLNLLVLLPPHWEELTPLAQLLHKSQQMAASSESKEIAKILNIIQEVLKGDYELLHIYMCYSIINSISIS